MWPVMSWDLLTWPWTWIVFKMTRNRRPHMVSVLSQSTVGNVCVFVCVAQCSFPLLRNKRTALVSALFNYCATSYWQKHSVHGRTKWFTPLIHVRTHTYCTSHNTQTLLMDRPDWRCIQFIQTDCIDKGWRGNICVKTLTNYSSQADTVIYHSLPGCRCVAS